MFFNFTIDIGYLKESNFFGVVLAIATILGGIAALGYFLEKMLHRKKHDTRSNIVTEEEKLKEIKRPTKFSDGFSDLLKLELDTVSHINDALKDNAIPFEREIKGKRFNYDFVLPGSEKPKIFIEVRPLREKSSLFPHIYSDSIIRRSVFSKRDYPQSKVILFSNNKENFLTPQTQEILMHDVDKIFDLKDMKEFIIYLKEELKDI